MNDDERRLESLSRLAAGLAHDLNNVLGGISGLASASLMEVKEGPIADDLRQIVKTAKDGLAVSERLQLLGLAKSPRREVLLVSELAEGVRRALSAPEEVLALEIEDGLSLAADPRLLKDALERITRNALEATGGVGPVRLVGSLAQSPEGAAGAFVELSVIDTAQKLPKETPRELLEPYVSTRRGSRGRGLGLTIAWAIATGHGGTLAIVSEAKETRVTLRLPRGAVGAETARAAAELPRASKKSFTILVAEDERSMRQAAERLLSRTGYRVFCASDGEEAIQVFSAHRGEIDSVLVDILMPRRTGWEAIRAIRALEPKVIAVMMSAFENPETEARLREEGISAYLEKPFEPEVFLKTIEAALKGKE